MKTVPFNVPTEPFWDSTIPKESQTADNAVTCKAFLQVALDRVYCCNADMMLRVQTMLEQLEAGHEILMVDVNDIDYITTAIRGWAPQCGNGRGNRCVLRALLVAVESSTRLLHA